MGIGGSGISAVAQIAKAYEFEVSGCDLEASRNTHYLEKAGIPVQIGHDVSHLKNVSILAHTPAVFYQSSRNIEYLSAAKNKISMTWEEFMAKYLQKAKFVIAVAGTHGKGTTAAMLAYILEIAGLDPTVEIGANLLDWEKRNYRIGKGNYFVCEADEFNDNFLVFSPQLAIVTSIELDHPDYFANFDAVLRSFEKFTARLTGKKILILNKDNNGCVQLAKNISKKFKGKIIYYSALSKSKYKLKLPGEHIRSDASGAAAAAKALGVKESEIMNGLEGFGGLERRFEYKGEFEGVKVYDDYAHHPTAIAVNIKATREAFPKKKVWVVLQPHMHSRLQTLFEDFVKALRTADRVVVTDVYTRREQGVCKPTGKELAIAVDSPKATYVGGDLLNVANFVKRNTTKKDVVIVMGAGDSYRVAEYLVSQ